MKSDAKPLVIQQAVYTGTSPLANLFWFALCLSGILVAASIIKAVTLGYACDSIWTKITDLFDSFATFPIVSAEQSFILPLSCAAGGLLISSTCPRRFIPARALVAALITVLGCRYLYWRLFYTIDFPGPILIIFRILFLLVEIVIFANTVGFLLQATFPTNRTQKADQNGLSVVSGMYCPPVDILVPTYNEQLHLLRRSLIGCQAIDYPNKNIYLLDEKSRPEMQALCEELGCIYVTRNSNYGAKAGNLNNALNLYARGELVAVFDADFVPSKNFLVRTVGFFQNERCGLVQTPQIFYTADAIQRNLGLPEAVTHEEDLFFQVAQPGRDRFNASICHGTSFVVRRSALDQIGGFPTETITEDFFTGIKLQAAGYDIKYLNEPLSAGDSAVDVEGFVAQRLRWAQGTWQVLASSTNPLLIPGLTFMQRVINFSSTLHWLTGALNLFPMIAPLLFLFFNLTPMRTDLLQITQFYLPFYLFRACTHTWYSRGKRSFFWSDIYSPVLMWPLFVTLIKTLIQPFGAPFRVTPKGLDDRGVRVSWSLIAPILTLLFLYLGGFAWFTWRSSLDLHDSDSTLVMIAWSIYNVILLVLAAQACTNVPPAPTFNRLIGQLPAELSIAGESFVVTIEQLFDDSAFIKLPAKLPKANQSEPAYLSIPEIHTADIECTLRLFPQEELLQAAVKFQNLTTVQCRRLVEYIYCQPGQWKPRTVSELRGISALVSSVFRLYPLAEA